ncbi:MAG TPA: DUF6701 domain-containing protein, partial [Pseudomonadales bacterium]|nr:DUF6701 domain-containing protein [Pseudomonadales bacterium]
ASYSEVGIIGLTAELVSKSYLGGSKTVKGFKQNVGRFRPDHFRVSFDSITPGCGAYTYMGQNFSLRAIITAENAANETTQNYTGSFAKLNLNDASNLGVKGIDTASATPLSSRLSIASFSGTWANGTATIDDTLALARGTSPDGVFSQFNVGMAPSDSDSVQATQLDLDSDNNGSADSVLLTTSEQRYGRVSMDNALASELIPLAIPLRVEYWNDATKSFVTATDDTCTDSQFSLTPAASPQWGNFILSGYQNNLSSGETVPIAFSGFSNGNALLTLSAPGTGNQGAVTVTATVPAWLQYDYNTSSAGDENPSARATFGLFKERDPVIYWREYFR